MIIHISLHKFKPHVSDTAIAELYENDLRLNDRMPFIIGFTAGSNTSLVSRSDVNQGFTHIVVVYLKDQADLDKYLSHPEHIKVEEILMPLLEKILVIDLEQDLAPLRSPACENDQNNKILHIVLHKFMPHVTDAAIKSHYAKDLRLKERMPFVLAFTASPNISLVSRSDVNQGFTHAVIVYLKDQADLDKYLPHPEHLKVKEIQAGLLEKILVVDLEQDGAALRFLTCKEGESEQKRFRSLQLQSTPTHVLQTDFTAGSGNALQACVASLFGLPLMSVPNFVTLPDYFAGISEFVAPIIARKMSLSSLASNCTGKLCILRGKSPRGSHGHVVVARVKLPLDDGGPQFDLLHDPHPDRTFLDTTEPYGWAMLFDHT